MDHVLKGDFSYHGEDLQSRVVWTYGREHGRFKPNRRARRKRWGTERLRRQASDKLSCFPLQPSILLKSTCLIECFPILE